jgi:hypothetical protein
LFIAGVAETHWGWVPRSGPLYAPFFQYFQAYLVLGLILLVRAHRSVVSSFRRNRTRLVIAGVLVSLAGGIVDFLRFILSWEQLYPSFAIACGTSAWPRSASCSTRCWRSASPPWRSRRCSSCRSSGSIPASRPA